jgi:hypothetical protein
MRAFTGSRSALLTLIGLAAIALLGACNFPTATPVAGCDPSSLIAPGIPIEDSQISDSLRPTVGWVYDGTCEPDSFRIELAPDGDFGSAQAIVGSTDSGTWTWTPSADLLPIAKYGWRVAAVSGSTIGPYSITRPLWTGPVCAGPYLRQPRLISPDTGDLVANPSPELRWNSAEETCLVPYFKFDVSTDPMFSDSVISGGTTGPYEAFDTQLDYLIDCHTYFWRVAATAGMDIASEYALDYFQTQFGDSCEGQIEPATVSGSLWRDECAAYGVCTDELPAGCQCIEGATAADGIRQGGEAGISGVTLAVNEGQCPSASFSSQYRPLTGASGDFSQTLPPGIYCFWIIEDMPYNDALEKPGRWTRPIAYDIPFGYTVTLVDGAEQTGIDFGWQVAPPGSIQGGIGGRLWNDVDADGVLDSGEPGIDGVEVWLSSGVCDPAWSNRQGGHDPTTRTDVNGRYGLGSNSGYDEWSSLPDGDYCAVVDPNDGYFHEIMGDGAWTYPVANAEIAMTDVRIQDGDGRVDVNFGWGEPIGIVGDLGFTATQNLYCRFGPATVYDVIGDLVPGESSAIMGRNSQSTWAQIQNLDRPGTCWVALSGGTVAGDLSTAAVLASPPTPTPKPAPSDSQAPSVHVSHAEGPSCGEVIYTATASDNVGVTRIKIYLNGDVVKTCKDTTSCSFTGGAGSYYATAEDAAHNVATSDTKVAPAEYC